MKSEGGLKTSALSVLPEMPSVMRRQFIPLPASVPKWNTFGRPPQAKQPAPPPKNMGTLVETQLQKKKKNDALYPLAIWHGNEESLKDLKLKNWGGGRFCHVKSLEGSKQRKNGQIELSQPGRSVVLELWNCNDQWVLRPIPSSPTKAANGSVSTTAGDVRGVQDQEPYDCQKGPNHANKPWGEGCQCSQNMPELKMFNLHASLQHIFSIIFSVF